MRLLTEGLAKRESRFTKSSDYNTISQMFDTIRIISPEYAAQYISGVAIAYEEQKKLGPERYKTISEVGDEVIRELWPKFQTVGKLMQDNMRERSSEVMREEIAAHVIEFVHEIRDRVISHPRVRNAFTGSEELLNEFFNDQALKRYEERLKKQLGIDF